MNWLIGRKAACWISLLLFAFAAGQAFAASGQGPKSVLVQVRLAEAMAENEDRDEAARRWIEILYYFGPSEEDARAEFELGSIALRRGRSDLAVSQWEKTVTRHPDSEWADRSRKALALLGKEPPAAPATAPPPYVTPETAPDERQFLIGEGDFGTGLYEFALRDYLKVPNFYPDSARAPEARFRAGTCQALLGRPDLAIGQWQRVAEDYPASPQARTAGGGIAAWKAVLELAALPPPAPALDDGWQPFRAYGTKPDQGLSYAEDLYQNGSLVYALQEYAKVLCDIYTPTGEENPHRAYARYRMGVCAYRLGHPNPAARQWRRLADEQPGGSWAARANRALAVVGATDAFSSDAGWPAPALPGDLPTPLIQRFHLAAQLMDCQLPDVAMKEYLKVLYVLTAGKPNPYQAEASYRLGLCQAILGRPGLALAAWSDTVADYPETEWAEAAENAIGQTKQRESALAEGLGAAQE